MKIGSIVKLKGFDELEYYIVTEVERFSTGDLYGVKQMYPVYADSPDALFGESDLVLLANPYDFDYKTILEIVKNQRDRAGLFTAPDYLDAIETNYKKIFKEIHDIINYHQIETVDKCLDALNDLDTLHKMFGDEAYLQLKEVVQKRLEELK
ncbi:hypothetical protein PQE66_gp185 [Bacillus phage PBC2]|uniref:Uncharacterized protein n=1 Tax=Bacillus phage PBC2 TaxID=1675029 RepID=A0A218KC86_9CAUD|nr:hypothetical protein PQE66_gp185 [Bacillus phage PBC2]AKQ08500.1 hypothetical protein PBC2_185 [Bacillus phage PBC2]